MSETNTPRTDALLEETTAGMGHDYNSGEEMTRLARTLERELTAATKRANDLEEIAHQAELVALRNTEAKAAGLRERVIEECRAAVLRLIREWDDAALEAAVSDAFRALATQQKEQIDE